MIKTIAIILAASLIIIFGIYYLFNYLSAQQLLDRVVPPLPPGNDQSCTLEAKVCPDGSSVGRTAPNCEFAACPNEAEGNEEIVTVTGTLECLPHKDSEGPQTMECAYGLKNEQNGLHYGLSDPGWKFLIGVPMNTKVTINGKLIPSKDTKYDTIGTIEIKKIEQ